jgi:hypothetical protein
VTQLAYLGALRFFGEASWLMTSGTMGGGLRDYSC